MLAALLAVSITVPPVACPVPAAAAAPNRAKAVQEGLAWIARHQNEDGSWGGNSLLKHCRGEHPCYGALKLGGHYDSGLTGLAVLAFLRSGVDLRPDRTQRDPLDPARSFVPGTVVDSALRWLKKVQKPDGSFEHEDIPFLYNQALAEMAMAEAAKAGLGAEWKECAQRGLHHLLAAQRKSPDDRSLWGWHYSPRAELEAEKGVAKEELHHVDVSATGWAVAALNDAAEAGLDVPRESLRGALDFLDSVAVTNGLVGYDKPEYAGMKVEGEGDEFEYHFGTLSAIAILIRLRATEDRANSFLDAAAKHVLEDLPRVEGSNLSIDYYDWFHGTEALAGLEGTQYEKGKKRHLAKPWNDAVDARLFALQDHTKGACSFGGWVQRDRWAYAGGPVYCTAMAVLTLQRIGAK